MDEYCGGWLYEKSLSPTALFRASLGSAFLLRSLGSWDMGVGGLRGGRRAVEARVGD